MRTRIRLVLPLIQVAVAVALTPRNRLWPLSWELRDGLNAPAALIGFFLTMLVRLAGAWLPRQNQIQSILSLFGTIVYFALVGLLWFIVSIEIGGKGHSTLTHKTRMRKTADAFAIIFGAMLAVMGFLVSDSLGSASIYSNFMAMPYFIWGAIIAVFYGHDLWVCFDTTRKQPIGVSRLIRIKPKTTITILIVVAVVAAASSRIYAITEGSYGYAMWNSSEAYFFVEVSDRGYSASFLRYPWVLFKAYVIGGFAGVEFPVNESAYLVVIRVTESGIERHVLKLDRTEEGGPGSDPGKYTPLEGRIYAFSPRLIGHFMQEGHLVANTMDDGLCWWAGDHFEKATQEERQRLDGIKRLTTTDFDKDKNGWARRGFAAAPADLKFTVDVGNKFRLSVNNVTKGREHSTVSID